MSSFSLSVSFFSCNSVIWSLHGKSSSNKAQHFHFLIRQVSSHRNFTQAIENQRCFHRKRSTWFLQIMRRAEYGNCSYFEDLANCWIVRKVKWDLLLFFSYIICIQNLLFPRSASVNAGIVTWVISPDPRLTEQLFFMFLFLSYFPPP